MTMNSAPRKVYMARLNRVVLFISNHLSEKLTLSVLAREAFFSPYHFHRIFSSIMGETPNTYINRIRLESAANMLHRNPHLSVTDIALTTGFSSSAAFSRSFKKHFGISPSTWKKQPIHGSLHSFKGTLEDQSPTQPLMAGVVIKQMPPYYVAYTSSSKGYHLKNIRAAWKDLCKWAEARDLFAPDAVLLGISYDNPEITLYHKCRYYTCVTVPEMIRPDNTVGVMDIAPGKYAIYHFEGPAEVIQPVFRQLYGEWLPDSGYQPAHLPCYEYYYALTYLQPSHCSHFAALSSLTKNGHVLVGRSYEFNDTMEDLRLCTTRIQGKYAHIGFSLLLFGRTDGMNEHGLSVTMSAAGLPIGNAPGMKPPTESGLHFWVLVRAILEQCLTVEEAIELIQKVPLGCNLNLIIAHKSGSAALIEIVGSHQSVKKITATTKDQSICATNHLTQPDMIQHIPMMMKHSSVRFDTITSTLTKAAPHITKETIKDLLSNPYPKGLCFHYYKEGFGTLWSVIFDLTEGTTEICFGSSSVNEWHTFDWLKPAEITQYKIKLPQEKAAPEFWNFV